MVNKIMYLRGTRSQYPVGCVAFSYDSYGVSYSVSIVHPDDKFDRKVAREIAEGRLLKSPYHIDINTDDFTSWEILAQVIFDIANNKYLPKRAQKVACEWIKANCDVTSDEMLAAE